MNTIFLDRDGVVNVRLIDDYVKTIDEFQFIEKSQKAIAILNQAGFKILLVTNQQGIGKALMSEQDLNIVHTHMLNELKKENAFIEKIYFCPHLKSLNCRCRKPNTKMIEDAIKDFPTIKKEKSIMIGDSESDINLAKNAGIKSILISKDNIYNADYCFDTLYDAALFLEKNKEKIF